MTVNETTIRADAIAGLLDGWVGPVLLNGSIEAAYVGRTEHGVYDVAFWGPNVTQRWESLDDLSRIRLNCLRPEVQAHIGSVLAAGVKCEPCRGTGKNGTLPAQDSPRDLPCYSCSGTGWTRKPSPIYPLTDAARTNALSNQHIAEAVAWSVRSVARGGEVLRKVIKPRPTFVNGPGWFGDEGYMVAATPVRFRTKSPKSWGWQVGRGTSWGSYGPETGLEGRAKADAALLAANIAYIDGGALVLPGELE